jgi:hypothetical protein
MKNLGMILAGLFATSALCGFTVNKSMITGLERVKQKVENAAANVASEPFDILLKKAKEKQQQEIKNGKKAEDTQLVITTKGDLPNIATQLNKIDKDLNSLYWSYNLEGYKKIQSALKTSDEKALAELKSQINSRDGTAKPSLMNFAISLNSEKELLDDATDKLIKILADPQTKNNVTARADLNETLALTCKLKAQLKDFFDISNKILNV